MKNAALVTGGSSGVGYSLAEEFASHHFNLVLVSHNPENLGKAKAAFEKKYGVEVLTLEQDLRDPNSAENVYSFCREKQVEVEALVNNAGAGIYGPFASTFVDDNEAIVQLDVVTLIDLTYLFLHDMLERKRGYILNVASTAAFQPGPNLSVFYASKAFVESFTEAIAEENKHSGVKISVLCPGPVNSQFLEKSGMQQSVLLTKFPPVDPQTVASYGYKKLMAGRVVIIPGRKNRFRAFCTRIFSRKAIRGMMSKITAPKKD